MSARTDTLGMDSLFEDERPPYWVQSMADRAAIPRNGLTAVSTFSGSGGSSLGLKTAGFTIPYAVEFTPQGAATYRANHPGTYVDQRDVRTIQPGEILDHVGMKAGELDLFEGSPPCSSFSLAGVRAGSAFEDRVGKVKPYSEGIKQRTDDLFDEWVRLVEGLRPKAILAENVPDMARPGAASAYLYEIRGRLETLGYEVHVDVHSSLAVGCATMRNGNVGRALDETLTARKASLVAIEESAEMGEKWWGPGHLAITPAQDYDWQPYDFGVAMLCLMFLRPDDLEPLLDQLVGKLRPGGALVLVERMLPPAGYLSIVSSRLTLEAKRLAGATGDEIVTKELSLAGAQRPLDRRLLEAYGAVEWFRYGDFAGWVIEAPTHYTRSAG